MIDGRENTTVGSDLNFRFRMLLKGAVKAKLLEEKYEAKLEFPEG